jgi:predicted porin
MKKKILAIAAAMATLPAAYAVDFKAGNWDMTLGGNANAFYTGTTCKGDVVTGLALGSKALACGDKSKSTTIGNGLLPSMLNVGAKTTEAGYDIAAVIGVGVAVATDSSIAQNNVVDVRNAYVSVGNKDMGTVKMGRDYGLFGLHAVLNDMTLLGVGAATQGTQNGRVSLGHIGSGYAYAGTYGQMVYTTPSLGGVNVDVGLMNPVTPYAQATTEKAGSGPAVQARATYAGQGFKVWAANKSQDFTTYRMNASEVGASMNSGPYGFVANYQSGNGLGLLADGDQGDIKSTNSFVQATYKATAKLKLGLGVGKGGNDKAPTYAGSVVNLRSNQNTTAAAYYSLTPSLTVVGELGNTTSKGFDGQEAKQNSIAVGGIFFF